MNLIDGNHRSGLAASASSGAAVMGGLQSPPRSLFAKAGTGSAIEVFRRGVLPPHASVSSVVRYAREGRRIARRSTTTIDRWLDMIVR
jgi:hypothetical protein